MRRLGFEPYVPAVMLVVAGGAAASAYLIATLDRPGRSDLITLWVTLIPFAASAIGVCVYETRRKRAFSLISVVSAFYVLGFCAGAPYYFHPGTAAGGSALKGFAGSYNTHGLLLALRIAFLGWVLLTVGYVVTGPLMRICRSIPRPSPPGLSEMTSLFWVLEIVGALGRLGMLATGVYFRYGANSASSNTTSATANLVSVAANLPLIAAGLVIVCRNKPAARIGRYYWPVLAYELVWALPSGQRVELVGLALLVLVCRYYDDHGVRPRTVALLAVIAIFVVFPFGTYYRGPGGAANYQGDPVGQAGKAVSQMVNNVPGGLLKSGFQETFSRFSDIASFASITTQGRNRYPFGPSQTVDIWVGALLPRFLVPGKYNPSQSGAAFGRNYGIIYDRGNASISTTQIGDLYAVFGWEGATLGMFLLGLILRGFDEFFYDRRTNMLMLAIFATEVSQFALRQEATVAIEVFQSLRELLVYVVVSAAGLWFIRVSRYTSLAVR